MMMLTLSTRAFLVPFALGVMGTCACILAGGCSKEEPQQVDPASPQSYMHDEKFLKTLTEDRAEQQKLLRARNDIADRMKAMVEAKKAELKTDDLNKVKEALEKSPDWQDLYAQCTNANAAVMRQRAKLLGDVRKRITPKTEKKPITKPISK